jgi:hypothetical protein
MARILNITFVSALFVLMMLSFSTAAETDIGTKKLDDCIDLIQTCADCTYVNFSSYTMPNGTREVVEWAGTQSGVTFTYNDCNITNQLGEWIIDGHGDLDNIDTVFTYKYDVTSTGNPTPEGMPTFQMGVMIIIFAVACFFLFLSSQFEESGFKIFFLITSLIFLAAAMLTGYMVSADGNVAGSINTTTLSLFWVLGMILIILFLYFMIRQTIVALDYFRMKRGHAWSVPSGRGVGGMASGSAY